MVRFICAAECLANTATEKRRCGFHPLATVSDLTGQEKSIAMYLTIKLSAQMSLEYAFLTHWVDRRLRFQRQKPVS